MRVWFKPISLFVCGITECCLSGWDLLSWEYGWVYDSSLSVCSSVVLQNVVCLAEICWVDSMDECMVQALQPVRLWYYRMLSIWLRSVELRVWMSVWFKPYSLSICGITECCLSGWDLLSWEYGWVYDSNLTACSSVVLQNVVCLAEICWVESMDECMVQALQSVRLWYYRMLSIWLRSVELRVWMSVWFKPYSLSICGITECYLSGWDLLSWQYWWVYDIKALQPVRLLYNRMCFSKLGSVELIVWMSVWYSSLTACSSVV